MPSTNVHVVTGFLVVIGLSLLGVQAVQYPLVVFAFFIANLLPDIDVVFGKHRGAIHSIFVGVLIAALVLVAMHEISAAFKIPPIIVFLFVISLLHILHYYTPSSDENAKTARARTCAHLYLQALIFAVWIAIDFGGLTNITKLPAYHEILFALMGGFMLHLLVDYVFSNTGMLLLWPLSSRNFSLRAPGLKVATGSYGESYLYTILLMLTTIGLTTTGKVTRTTLVKLVGGDMHRYYVLVGIIVAAVGLWAYFKTRPSKPKGAQEPPKLSIIPKIEGI